MSLLACDPGLGGAFAHHEGRELTVTDMPTYQRTVAGQRSERRFLDEEGVIHLLEDTYVLGARRLVLEKVSGAPGQSAPAAFTFGYGVGVIIGAARLIGYQIDRVEPAIWKRALRVPADKRAARDRASELLPRFKHFWPLAKHDGRAEAAMLGLYALGEWK